VKKENVARRVIAYELIGFALVIGMLWVNEITDLPHRLFGTVATPVNWRESLLETVLALPVCFLAIWLSRRLLLHIKYLEGFLIFCAGCKRVRSEGKWIPIDAFMHDHSEVHITHGLCPDCLDKSCSAAETPPEPLWP
jgi:hypothetical protein